MNPSRIKHVYFFLNKSNNNVKIGSSFKPLERKKYIESKNNPYEILYIFSGGGKLKEKEFHIRFNKYLKKGEWFYYSKEIKDFISTLITHRLIWIGQDIKDIPIKNVQFGVLTDKKTFDMIKENAQKKCMSVGNFSNHCLWRIVRNDKVYNSNIITENEYNIFYRSECYRLIAQIEKYKKIIQSMKSEREKLTSNLNKKDSFLKKLFDSIKKLF